MKTKLFRICACVSIVLFIVFVCLYVCVLIFDFNPDSHVDWRSISIGHGTISIAHSRQPSNDKSRPGMLIYPEDGSGNLHLTVSKLFFGGELLFLNQNMPEEGFMRFVTPGDTITNKTSFQVLGIKYGSLTHTASLLGFSKDDRETETELRVYGIYFRDTSHTVDKAHNWWTWMISLWYPIILSGILPAIFAVKKLRVRKSASTKKTIVEK